MSFKSENKLIWIAHRGGASHRPENTCAAFEHIARQGISWIETDIRLTCDSVPVLSHDDRITFHGNVSRTLRENTLSELLTLALPTGQKLFPLSKLLDDFRDVFHFDLEIKEVDAVEPVCKLVVDKNLVQKSVITSFIPEALDLSRKLIPELQRGLLIDRLAGKITSGNAAIKAALLLDCKYILPEFKRLSDSFVANAHSEGLKVLVWTVNDLTSAKRLLDMGVDGIISDLPDILKSKIEKSRTI